MTEPPSRQYEAYKANGWPNEVAEYDPHGVAAGGMYADCEGCRSRDWFGPNPWSEPGSAKHLDFVMGGTGGNILGVCGASPSWAVHKSMSPHCRGEAVAHWIDLRAGRGTTTTTPLVRATGARKRRRPTRPAT